MWKLVPLQSEGETIYLLPGKEYVVGRKNCDILLASDQSISRAHAQFSLSDQNLTLKDTSKYGTFVNDAQLATGTSQTLKPGDRLTFGVYQSKFKLEQENVKVCSSCLENERKAELSQALSSLGGRLVSSWDQECTHLVMPSVKVTIKTICALLCGRPIVKLEFFTEFSRALKEKRSPPQPQSYYPEIDEPSLSKEEVDLNSRPERKRLFAGKTFIFLNAKQMKRLSQAVSCGGGRCQLLEEGSVPAALLESPGTCVVDMSMGSSQTLVSASTRKWTDAVGQVLHRRGLRWIPESEIGLAAIYVNNSSYCNPCSPTETESLRMKPVIPGPSLSQSTAVDETVLPAASQNITAYALNTEPSQGISCPKVRGDVTSVGETPERQTVSRVRPTTTTTSSSSSSSSSSSTFQKPAINKDLPSSCTTVTETMMSSHSAAPTSQSERSRKPAAVTTVPSRKTSSVDSAKFRPPSSVAKKASPQKQSSLTNFFQPVSKKRPRDGSSEASQSDSKLFRLDSEGDSELDKKSFATGTPTVTSAHATARTHTATHSSMSAAQNQNKSAPGPVLDSRNRDASSRLGLGFSASPSLGLGPGLGSGLGLGSSKGVFDGLDSECNLGAETTNKRKEMASNESAVPDLDLSLEELESIMDDDMDMDPEPEPEPVANKKARVDQEEHTPANQKPGWSQAKTSSGTPNQNTKNQTSEWAKDSSTNKQQRLGQGDFNGFNGKQGLNQNKNGSSPSGQTLSETLKHQSTKNQTPETGNSSSTYQNKPSHQEKKSSTNQTEKWDCQEEVKNEEVSFVVAKSNDSTDKGKAPAKSVPLKEEKKESKPVDEDLPRNLLLVEFKSLVVTSATSRTRAEPLHSHNQNFKNFKRFRKVPVPGSQGLPQIIGGSDLVAHSKSKNTELEEWLKEAAEDDKQREIEQSVGDELFRYNPKPSAKKFGRF